VDRHLSEADAARCATIRAPALRSRAPGVGAVSCRRPSRMAAWCSSSSGAGIPSHRRQSPFQGRPPASIGSSRPRPGTLPELEIDDEQSTRRSGLPRVRQLARAAGRLTASLPKPNSRQIRPCPVFRTGALISTANHPHNQLKLSYVTSSLTIRAATDELQVRARRSKRREARYSRNGRSQELTVRRSSRSRVEAKTL